MVINEPIPQNHRMKEQWDGRIYAHEIQKSEMVDYPKTDDSLIPRNLDSLDSLNAGSM